jgi:Zn-dependent protease
MDGLLIFVIIAFIYSVIIHELSHGLMADKLGDPTPRLAGRLTLNPLAHLDPFGSFLVPLILILFRSGIVFGWAKPVPVNPYNFKDQKYGELKVGLAGVTSNIILAIIFGLPVRFLPQNIVFFSNISTLFAYIAFINILLAVFNLFPLPPFDGSHVVGSLFQSYDKWIKTNPYIQFVSIFAALIFIIYIGIPLIISPLFTLITGGGVPLF